MATLTKAGLKEALVTRSLGAKVQKATMKQQAEAKTEGIAARVRVLMNSPKAMKAATRAK